jgi:hypothetical protein
VRNFQNNQPAHRLAFSEDIEIRQDIYAAKLTFYQRLESDTLNSFLWHEHFNRDQIHLQILVLVGIIYTGTYKSQREKTEKQKKI